MMRIDFHIHSCYSKDSLMSLEGIISTLKSRGINCMALTDHNNVDGIYEIQKIAPEGFKIIPGEEIKTLEGEIIGLFLKEKIQEGLSPEDTIKKIKEQDGLVYVPHPFDRIRKTRIPFPALERIRKDIDIIEVFNARNFFNGDNQKSLDYAMEHNIPMGVGTDSHTFWELGACYVEVSDFSSPEELVEVLKSGIRVTNLNNPLVHLGSFYSKYRKKLYGLWGK